ncbi:MAG: Trk system potassium transporter TrkH [Nitrospinaceae bacterium]|nr:MAG: Trk system potassium transporter TrkH [Nitrospinaceae bacterium]
MNIKAIFNVVGALLVLLSGLLLIPIAISLHYKTPALPNYLDPLQAFSLTLAASLLTGLALWKFLPSGVEKLRDREGFAIVTFSWVGISFFGSLPFVLTGVCPEFIDAFFESMSGFTTTGASVLTDIDTAPKEILFWRNLTQWVGGMGIIMLSLAIFPMLGIGSSHLFKAEIPGGSTVERMQPRLAETAKMLWKTYIVLTLLEIMFLLLGGVSLFDAVCHTFSTVATGGFSPHNESVGYFESSYVQSVIILFMFLGGINFALHYQLVTQNFSAVVNNPEFRGYCSMIIICILFATWGLIETATEPDAGKALQKAAFTVVSINSTTGFVTDDFSLWPDFLQVLILGIMIVGGCSGSTSGSLKVIRFIILFKVILREFQKLMHPRAIFHVKVGGKTIEPDHLTNVVALTFLFLGLSGLSCILLSFMGMDLTTSLSASVATLFNIGPGLGMVGPMGNYADLPTLGKVISITWMLMGRLEIFGVILIFMPTNWNK